MSWRNKLYKTLLLDDLNLLILDSFDALHKQIILDEESYYPNFEVERW